MQIPCSESVARSSSAPSAEQDVRARVHELLLVLYPPGPPLERRSDRRYPYPQLIQLTPVDADGRTAVGEPLVVVGATLSERGMGFFHPNPLPYRRAIATFHAGHNRWLGLLIDLSWCRFTSHGWYESGGRFLEAVPVAPPVARTRTAAEGEHPQQRTVHESWKDSST